MLIKICLFNILLLSVTSSCFFSNSMAKDLQLFVGKVKVPIKENPNNYIELKRNKKILTLLTPIVRVKNGDIIIPKIKNTVKLIYEHTGCGEFIVNDITSVNCNPSKFKKAGWFLTLFSDSLDILKINLKKAKAHNKQHLMTLKGEKKNNISCFPDNLPLLSPWPPNNSTFLYNEAILFRWDEIFFLEEVLPCSKAKIVFLKNGNIAKPLFFNMKIGEFLKVDPIFEADTFYRWYIEVNGNIISENYVFKILGKQESENIHSQIKEVEKIFQKHSDLYKAFYLQLISDATPSLDLYASSCNFFKPPFPDIIIEKMISHCWP